MINNSEGALRELQQIAIEFDLGIVSPAFVHKLAAASSSITAAAKAAMEMPPNFEDAIVQEHAQPEQSAEGFEILTSPSSDDSPCATEDVAPYTMRILPREEGLLVSSKLPAATSIPALATVAEPRHFDGSYIHHTVGYESTASLLSHLDHAIFPRVSPPKREYEAGDSHQLQQTQSWNFAATMASPNLTLPFELPLPHSYSFQETKFSRWWHRSCLEYASRALNRADTCPETIDRLFGHALRFSTLTEIAARIHRRLNSSIHEDLASSFSYPKPHLYMKSSALHQDAWLGPDELEGFLQSSGIEFDPNTRVIEYETGDPEQAPQSVRVPAWSGQEAEIVSACPPITAFQARGLKPGRRFQLDAQRLLARERQSRAAYIAM